MRIHSLDKRYALDRAGFQAFLREQGFTKIEIDQLNIYIRREGAEQDTLGDYHHLTIFLYTHGSRPSEVNVSLLHETRHYWQDCQYTRQRELAYQAASQLQGRARRKAIDQAFRIRPPDEKHIDYWQRPSEVDARSFAERYALRHQFIAWQRTCQVTIPLAWIEEQCLEKRVRYLGGQISKKDDLFVVSGVLKSDLEKLTGFLAQQTGRKLVIRY